MLSVITPTYNRAYVLKNAYISLCNQTCNDFEWIIVDDGSTDNTQAIVAGWISTTKSFSITYIYQHNGGKHRAVNKAMGRVKYNYVLILDSDDFLTDDAVFKIHSWIKTLGNNNNFAGVAGLRGFIGTNKIIGQSPKKEFVDATNTERIKYDLQGDKAEIYKTEILKKYPFPEFEGENFISESASWDRIASDGYKLRWFSEVIYMCNYLSDGLTNAGDEKRYKNNFCGFTYCCKLQYNCYPFPYNFFRVGVYYNISKKLGKSRREIKQNLNISALKLLTSNAIYNSNKIIKKLRGNN